ncbi:MAG: cytochrome P450, partial [Actinomycetota bacterium]|nr:cytochrome P450 [Actinomycetota bacterium]
MKIELTDWLSVKEAFRSKHLRQAGYTEGAIVMEGTLLDLHGLEHRERRRLENRLFRREIFSYWEHQVLGRTIDATIRPFVEKGSGDLAQIGYRCAMNLTATIAGIDQDPRNEAETELLYSKVKKFSEGATIMHSTRDKDEVRSEVREAMTSFHNDFYIPSKTRREDVLSDLINGKISEEELPRD